MNIPCVRCNEEFHADTMRGYCDDCLEAIQNRRERIHAAQRPAPGICADGKFADENECPKTVYDHVSQKEVCGLCGSDEIEMGYGLGSGYGMGSYTFCTSCNSFLNFCEDSE